MLNGGKGLKGRVRGSCMWKQQKEGVRGHGRVREHVCVSVCLRVRVRVLGENESTCK